MRPRSATAITLGADRRDPVCGMTVDPATASIGSTISGETFHFCSAGCRTNFAAEPDGIS